MGVATKYRRRLTVAGRQYVWYVAQDVDDAPPTARSDLLALTVVSSDKSLIIRYHLGQTPSDRRHITVIGRDFCGVQTDGRWRRYSCPDWAPAGIVRPNVVRAIIEWCQETGEQRTEVDYSGEAVQETDPPPGESEL